MAPVEIPPKRFVAPQQKFDTEDQKEAATPKQAWQTHAEQVQDIQL
jgi:hypothetical protein